jgi:hypothetical protein
VSVCVRDRQTVHMNDHRPMMTRISEEERREKEREWEREGDRDRSSRHALLSSCPLFTCGSLSLSLSLSL